MDFNLEDFQQLARFAEEHRRKNAPRDRHQLTGALIVACALPIAAVYESAIQRQIGVATREEIKSRMLFLWENDPVFHHAVQATVMNVLQLLDDYARRSGVIIE